MAEAVVTIGHPWSVAAMRAALAAMPGVTEAQARKAADAARARLQGVLRGR